MLDKSPVSLKKGMRPRLTYEGIFAAFRCRRSPWQDDALDLAEPAERWAQERLRDPGHIKDVAGEGIGLQIAQHHLQVQGGLLYRPLNLEPA